jgi:sialate O-acetylesterase
MTRIHARWATLALLSLATWSPQLHADVSLPKIIDSHMVLQRKAKVPIWGWATPGESVSVTLDGGKTIRARAKKNGSWMVILAPLTADGKPHKLTIKGKNTIELTDILIGEVWIGSGQSNMEWQLRGSENGNAAISDANHPEIRLFHVQKKQFKEPQKDVIVDDKQGTGKWKVCSPQTVPSFSAVLYFFGKKLHGELKVPIGLINSSWGGSPIEPWTIDAKGSGGMYNGMIAPIKPYAAQGVIWYQGETNVLRKNGFTYFDKKKALIEGWRKAWGRDLSFYYVQIAPWQGKYPGDELQKLWEAQVACLRLPKTGMAVTTDIVHNIKDIHPRNKLDVGNRLARWALARDYGQDVVVSGPLYKAMKIKSKKITLQFAYAKGLKARDGNALTQFQIAGADGAFVDANATIEGETIVVSADTVSKPKHVRFGWNNSTNPNLVNGEGLPASPFQTKGWRGGTGELRK